MRARWVSRKPSPELPIVAHLWPWKYYFVSTVQIDQSHPSSPIARGLETGEVFKKSHEDVMPGLGYFVTQIFKCDRNGIPKSMDYAFYERKYSDLTQAKLGHEETVDLLAQGRLKLKRISYKLKDLFPK
jgi:hypothetical protein